MKKGNRTAAVGITCYSIFSDFLDLFFWGSAFGQGGKRRKEGEREHLTEYLLWVRHRALSYSEQA